MSWAWTKDYIVWQTTSLQHMHAYRFKYLSKYMHIYIYRLMQVCLHTYVHTYIYGCTDKYIIMHVSLHTYFDTYSYKLLCVCLCTCIHYTCILPHTYVHPYMTHAHILTCIDLCMSTYLPTYIHTYIPICIYVSLHRYGGKANYIDTYTQSMFVYILTHTVIWLP